MNIIRLRIQSVQIYFGAKQNLSWPKFATLYRIIIGKSLLRYNSIVLHKLLLLVNNNKYFKLNLLIVPLDLFVVPHL